MKKNVHFYTMLAVCTAIVCGLFSVYGTLAAREIQVYYAITPPPVKPVKPAVIRHGTASDKIIALTFDACERKAEKYGYDKKLIEVLTQTGTPATLFLGGKWMLSHPDETRYLASIPYFELANHGLYHRNLRTLFLKKTMTEEIEEPQAIMYALTGRQAKFFRPPYGYYSERSVKIAAQYGMKLVLWNVVSGDPDKKLNAARITRNVVHGASAGSIVVMHMNERGWHTAEALPSIIRELKARGYRFVTLSELVSEQRAQSVKKPVLVSN